MSPRKSSKDTIYQLKVTLRGSKPPIWRRLLVSGEISLLDFHRIIQVAMGWTNSHLHQFIIDEKYYSIPSDEDWQPVLDERKYRLAKFAAAEGRKFVYEYDFGDSWEHLILVEKILPSDPGKTYPLCIKGKRACPPEDVGGVWGYEEFLEAIRDPAHDEHGSYLEWVGGNFDPEAFDLAETNQRLREIDKMEWWDEWEGQGINLYCKNGDIPFPPGRRHLFLSCHLGLQVVDKGRMIGVHPICCGWASPYADFPLSLQNLCVVFLGNPQAPYTTNYQKAGD